MTEIERYLFDRRGYLVVPGVLSEEEVGEINEVIDGVLPSWHTATKTGYVMAGWDEENTQGVNDSRNARLPSSSQMSQVFSGRNSAI